MIVYPGTMDPLDLKNAKSVIVFLSGVKSAMKSDLAHLVRSHQVLDNLLSALEEGGYLKCESTVMGPRKYTIFLTRKGLIVSHQLKKLDTFSNEDSPEGRTRLQMPVNWREKYSGFHIRNDDGNGYWIVEEITPSGEKIREVVLRMEIVDDRCRLNCEFDNTDKCPHVDYAWSLPEIREMIDAYVSEVHESQN